MNQGATSILFFRLLVNIRWTIAALLIATACFAGAQNNPVRDAAAITAMQNSIASMGGAVGWAGIQDWTITDTVSVNGSQAGTFSWIGSGIEFLTGNVTSNSTNQFFSGHGSPARVNNGTVNSLNAFVSAAAPPLYLPGVCLTQELANSVLTIQYIGPTTTNGVASVQVHVVDNSTTTSALVTPHDWYFDATTYTPLEVQFRIPPNENASAYINGTFDFLQFQAVNGLMVSSQSSLTTDLGITKSYAMGSTVFNSGVPQSTFDAPGGGQ